MRLALTTLLLLAGCGDGSSTDCACTVMTDTGQLALGCGDEGCLGGMLFGCEEDNVLVLGRCGAALDAGGDGVGGGACLASQAMCDPGSSSCCATDGGIAPSCDPVTRHCCVPRGGACAGSADCCGTAACQPDGTCGG